MCPPHVPLSALCPPVCPVSPSSCVVPGKGLANSGGREGREERGVGDSPPGLPSGALSWPLPEIRVPLRRGGPQRP